MALAARLIFGEAHPADCPSMGEAGFEQSRERLAEWLGEQTESVGAVGATSQQARTGMAGQPG